MVDTQKARFSQYVSSIWQKIPPIRLRMGLFVYISLFSSLFTCLACSKTRVTFKKNQYTIALPAQWQYIQLYESDKNVGGFLSDFIVKFGLKTGIDIRLITVEPRDIATLLETKVIDACCIHMPTNPNVERQYSFSDPIFVNGTVLVVAKKSSFTSKKDLDGCEIAFERSQNATATIGANATWLLHPYETATQALDDIIQGRLDAVVLNYMKARTLMQAFFKSQFRIIFPPLTYQNINLMVRRQGAEELITAINSFIEQSIQNGEYLSLLQYWNIDTPLDEVVEKEKV